MSRPHSPLRGGDALTFEPLGRRVPIREGETLLEAAQSGGIELQAICSGEGTCGGCRVRPTEGRLTEPTEKELVLLAREERDDGVRLACQARALGPARVQIPAESLTAAQRLQVDDAA
ncbi:MAG: 2Fe-2S iron-sulfur cluster-binding protein, partial [Syntrophomonadaceae bacterium]